MLLTRYAKPGQIGPPFRKIGRHRMKAITGE